MVYAPQPDESIGKLRDMLIDDPFQLWDYFDKLEEIVKKDKEALKQDDDEHRFLNFLHATTLWAYYLATSMTDDYPLEQDELTIPFAIMRPILTDTLAEALSPEFLKDFRVDRVADL